MTAAAGESKKLGVDGVTFGDSMTSNERTTYDPVTTSWRPSGVMTGIESAGSSCCSPSGGQSSRGVCTVDWNHPCLGLLEGPPLVLERARVDVPNEREAFVLGFWVFVASREETRDFLKRLIGVWPDEKAFPWEWFPLTRLFGQRRGQNKFCFASVSLGRAVSSLKRRCSQGAFPTLTRGSETTASDKPPSLGRCRGQP